MDQHAHSHLDLRSQKVPTPIEEAEETEEVLEDEILGDLKGRTDDNAADGGRRISNASQRHRVSGVGLKKAALKMYQVCQKKIVSRVINIMHLLQFLDQVN